MSKTDLDCPSCGHEFEFEEWEEGECPVCFNRFSFEEDCLPDYSECWTAVYWERYNERL